MVAIILIAQCGDNGDGGCVWLDASERCAFATVEGTAVLMQDLAQDGHGDGVVVRQWDLYA